MISSSTHINLQRKEKNYQASVALIKGNLSELKLHKDKLHPREMEVYNAYKYDRRKTSYLSGRIAAKFALLQLSATCTPESIWIDSGIFTFPIVRCPSLPNVQVSLSHCEDIGIALAFPEAHPLGVDLEKIDVQRQDVVLSQLTDMEKKLLTDKSQNNAHGYYSIFSMKEALSKVIKTGMMLDFKFFEIDEISYDQKIMEAKFRNFGQYKAFATICSDYVISFALPRRTTVSADQYKALLKLIRDFFDRF